MSHTAAKFGLAHVAYFEGRIEEARSAFERCVVETDAEEILGHALEARWMVAECCLRLEDVPGFLKIVAEVHDPRRSAGLAARPFHAHVLEGLGRLVQRDWIGCEAAFAKAFRLIETRGVAPDAAIEAFLHWFYGIALSAVGEDRRAVEQLQAGRARLQAAGLKGQIVVANQAEPQLMAFLRRHYVAESAAAIS